ncbi:MAG: Flp pilus assembly complex ATPase component TadA [Candidatus Riflebacteria bacterium]|nr:Flp pilus assembly complex ATPase component TadA [Candidatus Riflebacteria bacterium]
MQKFDCEIKNSNGEIVKTSIVTDDFRQLSNLLSEKGFILTKATPAKIGGGEVLFSSVSHKEMMYFLVQLKTMLIASIPLVKALSIIADKMENIFFKNTLEKIIMDIRSGKNFYRALQEHPKIFNNIFCELIKIGESADILDKALESIEKILDFDYRIYSNALMIRLILIAIIAGCVLLPLFKYFPFLIEPTWLYETLLKQIGLVILVIFGIIVVNWAFFRFGQSKSVIDEDFFCGLKKASEETPLTKMVNTIICQAVQKGASDIHIDPAEDELRIRYRINGTLDVFMTLQPEARYSIISRLKFMSGMDISKCLTPQEGRFNITIADKSIDFSVNTIPVAFGEKIHLQILDKSSIQTELDNLNFTPANLALLKKAITQPNGIILVTGPVGSGKITTLYACLNAINGSRMNIFTVENPIEYKLKMVNQIQPEIDLNLETTLQAIFRQDADVIILGEIRNIETAQIAFEAALRGHLIFASMCTNSSFTSVNRLIDMGVEPFLISETLRCIVFQRRVRAVCKFCKDINTSITSEVLQNIGITPKTNKGTYFHAKGCDNCFQSGYNGWLDIHEVMYTSEKMRLLMSHKTSSDDLKAAAIENGMKTLREDLALKFSQGLTTAEEALTLIREN